MSVALTMMVRDEADVIAAVIEHHLAQGIDRIIVTDNASVDGTREILDDYARVAPVTVLHDPEHRKQQSTVVTKMARLAATEFGVDWVVNGDADEFLIPVDRNLKLRDVFAQLPASLGSFTVQVTNLVGPLARSGSGIKRLTYRDERSETELERVGLIAHPTPNAIHVASPEVEVAQGNHRVSVASNGEVPPELQLEVFHLPWRSLAQIERKTRNMGEGYEANPDLNPSPRHHGMRDWRRMRAGLLLPYLACRMPLQAELESGPFRHDDSLLKALASVDAALPARLASALDDSRDEPFTDAEIEAERKAAAIAAPFERIVLDELTNARLDADALRAERADAAVQIAGYKGHAERLERELDEVRVAAHEARIEAEATIQQLRGKRRAGLVRVTEAAKRAMRRPRHDQPG